MVKPKQGQTLNTRDDTMVRQLQTQNKKKKPVGEHSLEKTPYIQNMDLIEQKCPTTVCKKQQIYFMLTGEKYFANRDYFFFALCTGGKKY